jgi:hypothetical protein
MGNSALNLNLSSEMSKKINKPVNPNVDRDIQTIESLKKKIVEVLSSVPSYYEYENEDDLGLKILVDNFVLDLYDYIQTGVNKRLPKSIITKISESKSFDAGPEKIIANDNRTVVHAIGGNTQSNVFNFIKSHEHFWIFFTDYFNSI